MEKRDTFSLPNGDLLYLAKMIGGGNWKKKKNGEK